jgi:hypothetical protein
MPTRDELDKITWKSLHGRPLMVLAADREGRPLDYRAIEQRLQAGAEFEDVWSDFLHAFYDYRQASFFAYPSPESLSTERQAVLAGVAEC